MKIFKREDGTINTLKATITSFVVTSLLLGLLCSPMLLQDKAETTKKNSGNTTTTQQAGDFLPCKECDIEFYTKDIKLEFGEQVKIKDILDLKDVSIQNVKFTFDSDYLEKKQIEGEYYITTSTTLGETTLKAEYDKYVTTLKVTISSNKINEAKFSKDVYYVQTMKELELELDTTPKKANLSLIKFTSSDESIVKFSSGNKVLGVSGGKTTVKLSTGEIEDEATVIVMNTPFNLKLKIDGVYKEVDEYKYSSNTASQNMYIALKFENSSNYTQDDIKVSDVSVGSLSTTTSFDSVYSVDNSSLIYKVVVNLDPSKALTDNMSTITFKLPDNSEKSIIITR